MKRTQAEVIFNELYKQTFNEAYGYILAKTGDTVATPDILRNCYLDFFRTILKQKDDNIDNKRGFLFKIIRKHLTKFNEESLRSARPETTRIKKYVQFLEEELNTEILAPSSKDELNNMLERILMLISEKPDLQRRAFMLHHLYDFNIEQVAQELSLSEMCAGNYILNLTKEIKEMLLSVSTAEQEVSQ